MSATDDTVHIGHWGAAVGAILAGMREIAADFKEAFKESGNEGGFDVTYCGVVGAADGLVLSIPKFIRHVEIQFCADLVQDGTAFANAMPALLFDGAQTTNYMATQANIANASVLPCICMSENNTAVVRDVLAGTGNVSIYNQSSKIMYFNLRIRQLDKTQNRADQFTG